MLKDRAISAGARFAEYQGVETPAEYSRGASAEYTTAHESVVLMDRSPLGRIELSGADRADFLHRMSTNDMRLVKAGQGVQTVLTTPEAHIVELLTVYPSGETLLCITDPKNRSKVFDWFRRNIFFRDKVKPRDVSMDTAQLTLFGPRSSELLTACGLSEPSPFATYEARAATMGGMDVLLGRVPDVAGGGFDLICASDSAGLLWDRLMDAGRSMGISPLGTIAFEMLRIEAGVPLYGRELSEQYNPLEAGLNHAISFAKGCYTGQEVIARLDTYQRLKQRLARFALSSLPSAEPPIALLAESGDVGSLTSLVQLPAGHVLGLGYVRAKAFAEGAVFKLGTNSDATEATVISAVSIPAQGT